jgi:hypothetical protein
VRPVLQVHRCAGPGAPVITTMYLALAWLDGCWHVVLDPRRRRLAYDSADDAIDAARRLSPSSTHVNAGIVELPSAPVQVELPIASERRQRVARRQSTGRRTGIQRRKRDTRRSAP